MQPSNATARPSDPKAKHITARVPQDVFQALDDLARENDRTLSGEVRQALRYWIDRDKAAA